MRRFLLESLNAVALPVRLGDFTCREYGPESCHVPHSLSGFHLLGFICPLCLWPCSITIFRASLHKHLIHILSRAEYEDLSEFAKQVQQQTGR
jgi:hypothetical protein